MYQNESMYFGANKKTIQKAGCLRNYMTLAERILWQRLRDNQLGYRFLCQHPINNFIVDFYCHEKKLAIEVDALTHYNEAQKKYRSDCISKLMKFGIDILQFKNGEIYNLLESVIADIEQTLRQRDLVFSNSH